jgi:hypothetical protein
MKTLQKNILFTLRNKANNKNIWSKIKKVEQLPGVNNVSLENDSLTVYYDPYSVSDKFLNTCLIGMGFIPVSGKKKGPFARWIDTLAKSNERNFGNQRLDCCNVKRI